MKKTRRNFVKNLFAVGLMPGVVTAQQRRPAPVGVEQPTEQWTPEKMQTVATLKRELKVTMGIERMNKCVGISGDLLVRKIDNDLSNLDPILVGKHVVFSKKWLTTINNNKNGLTRQEFAQWRDNADSVYSAYIDLVGGTPQNGTKAYLDLISLNENAHCHCYANLVCYSNQNFPRKSIPLIKDKGCDFLIFHELAHMFAQRTRWVAEPESMADIFIAYALEKTDVKFSDAEGEDYRAEKLKKTRGNFEGKGTKTAFAYGDGTAYDYYLFGLLDKVGWEPFKQAFRSYKRAVFDPKGLYATADEKTVIAREFFERIAQCSGKGPELLRNLPDNGTFLDEYLTPNNQQIQRFKEQLGRQ